MRNALLVVLLAALLPQIARAQAFGVNQGDPVSRYGGKATGNGNQYEITVPLPNSEFESYVATATPETGICKVSGLGKTHNSDSDGTEVRGSFQRLKSALQEKYGPSKDSDFLYDRSVETEAKEFGSSLHKKERNLSSFWHNADGSSNFGMIEGIMLDARALSPDKTYVVISYEFHNINACKSARNARDNPGL